MDNCFFSLLILNPADKFEGAGTSLVRTSRPGRSLSGRTSIPMPTLLTTAAIFLPALPIAVYGPPKTSGTRDALAELILEKGCNTDPAMKALKESDKDQHKAVCTGVRTDGAYVEQGENDNLIVQKLAANPNVIGIFGFSFLEENMDKLKGISISGVVPTYAAISDFSYPGARPLYVYIKAAHLKSIRGLKEFAAEYAAAWGPDGYLKKKGMVISPDDVRAKNAEIVKAMTLLDPSTLK